MSYLKNLASIVRLLLVIPLLLLFELTSAKTWYVSNAGDDKNAGGFGSPFRSIQKGADLAQPGDTVLVLEGTYRERVAPLRGGTEKAPIVYLAEPGKRVYIKGSDIYEGKLKAVTDKVFSCNLTLMKFTDDFYYDSSNPFQVPVSSTPWLRDGAPEGKKDVVFNLGQVFVDGVMYRQYPLQEEMNKNAASWWYHAKTNEVLVHFDEKHTANQSQIELTTRRRIFAPHLRGLGYIHVIGFVMEHCGNQYPRNFWETKENAQSGALGIRSGHHWLIKNNVVRYAASIGIDVGTEGPDNERISQRGYRPEEVLGNRIENNYILDNGCTGVTGLGSKEMIVTGNIVMYNNNQMFRGFKRYESAGIKFHNNIDCIISDNLISDNYTYGIWFDNKYPNARVTKNVIVNNLRSGFFLEMGDYDFGTVLVDHNVIMDNIENQIYIHDASGGLFVNNLIAGTSIAKNADAENRDKYGQAVYIRQVGSRTKTYHHAFYNNLFIDNEIIYDINYPMWRGGEQRFLGNVYDEGIKQKGLVINPASDVPWPFDGTELRERIANDLGLESNRLLLNNSKVEVELDQWIEFWKIHSMHYDQDIEIVKNMEATYQPASQSVSLKLHRKPTQRDNTRWNNYYSLKYDLLEDDSSPGPFGKLTEGFNEYSFYEGLPPVDRGELPNITTFD